METPLLSDSMVEHTQNSLPIISLKEDLNVQQVISYTDGGAGEGQGGCRIIKNIIKGLLLRFMFRAFIFLGRERIRNFLKLFKEGSHLQDKMLCACFHLSRYEDPEVTLLQLTRLRPTTL